MGVQKNILVRNFFRSEQNFCPKKFWVRKRIWVKQKFGKHRLCVTIRFLVFSDIADFGGVLLVLLVTWVLCTPNPLNSAKSL